MDRLYGKVAEDSIFWKILERQKDKKWICWQWNTFLTYSFEEDEVKGMYFNIGKYLLKYLGSAKRVGIVNKIQGFDHVEYLLNKTIALDIYYLGDYASFHGLKIGFRRI